MKPIIVIAVFLILLATALAIPNLDEINNPETGCSDYFVDVTDLSSNFNMSGYNITADYYLGDGSKLTGITSTGGGNCSALNSCSPNVVYNQSAYYQIKVAWANVLDRYLTTVSATWFYMIGTNLVFNETMLENRTNETIDVKITEYNGTFGASELGGQTAIYYQTESSAMKYGNITTKWVNIDLDSTDDYATSDFQTDYNSQSYYTDANTSDLPFSNFQLANQTYSQESDLTTVLDDNYDPINSNPSNATITIPHSQVSDFEAGVIQYEQNPTNATIDAAVKYPNLDTDKTDDLDLPALDNDTVIRAGLNESWGEMGNVTTNSQIANTEGYTTNTGDITAITESGDTPLTFTGCDTGSCALGMDDVHTQAEFDVVVINRTEDEIGDLANLSLLPHIDTYYDTVSDFSTTLTDAYWCRYNAAGTEINCDVAPITDTTISNCSGVDCDIGCGNITGGTDGDYCVDADTTYSCSDWAACTDDSLWDANKLDGQIGSYYLDDTNSNASTACSGTTTYLDGEGNCDDISNVYINEAGDSTGDLTSDLNIDSNTLVVDYDTNEVGIGIADPLARLHVQYPSSGEMIFQAGSDDGGGRLKQRFGYNGYGWFYDYRGDWSGDNNEWQLWSEGAGSTDMQVYGIKQSGNIKFLKMFNLSTGASVNDIDTTVANSDNALITSGGVYDGLAAQDACSEITNCVPSAYDSVDDFSTTLDDGDWCRYNLAGTEINCDVTPFSDTDTDTRATTGQIFGNFSSTKNLNITMCGDNICLSVNVTNALCIELTGSSELCDGTDATGGSPDTTDYFNNENFTVRYELKSYYKKANLTIDYPNLDTDSTNDYATSNFHTDYAVTGFDKENMTLAYPNLDTDKTDDLDLPALDNDTVIRTANITWRNEATIGEEQITIDTDWDIGAFFLQALRFISDVAHGTAPLTVASRTQVTNLNASYAGMAYSADDLSCTNCIGGTEISELADADISNTLTCSIFTGAYSNMQLSNISNHTGLANMNEEDYGEFTKTGGVFIIDSGVIDADNIGTNAVQADELDVSDVSDDIAGDIAEGELANSIIVSADIKDGEIVGDDMADDIIIGRNLTISGNSSIGGHGIRVIGDCINWTIGTTYWAVGSGC